MKLRAMKRIKHNGSRYDIGEIFEIEDTDVAKRLVTLGAVIAEGVSESFKTLTNTQNQEDDELSDDEVIRMIDDGFTLENIKDEAAKIGFELPKSIKNKGDIIKFIVEQEMEDHYLDLLDKV